MEKKRKQMALMAMSNESQLAAGYTLSQARAAGYTLSQALAAGYTLSQARAAGYTLSQARAAGYTLSQALAAGYTLSQARAAGYTLSQARAEGYTLSQALAAGYTLSQALAAGYTLSQALAAGYTLSQARAAGYTLSQARAAGYTLSQARAEGYTLSQHWQRIYTVSGTGRGYTDSDFEEWNSIPVLVKPYTKLYADIKNKLISYDQSTFGPRVCPADEEYCGTPMCAAGHLVHMAGKVGYDLLEKYGDFKLVATMIHAKYNPQMPMQNFGLTDTENAIALIEYQAELEGKGE